MRTRVTGLENFKLTEASFRRLRTREVLAYVNLRTLDVTPEVQRLSPPQRFAYLAKRADRWINGLRRRHPRLSFQTRDGKLSDGGVRRWSRLPHRLEFRGPAREILAIASAVGVKSVHVARIAGYRRRRVLSSPLTWCCVRALVVIRIEHQRSGMQNTEDRFVLVRASSPEDAKKRLRQHWSEYATPYLNSEGQMVSWSLEKVIDVYDTCEAELDPSGVEVYSRLSQRRMRPEYAWRCV